MNAIRVAGLRESRKERQCEVSTQFNGRVVEMRRRTRAPRVGASNYGTARTCRVWLLVRPN